MAVLRTSEAVDHFVDGAVTATGDDELAAVMSVLAAASACFRLD